MNEAIVKINSIEDTNAYSKTIRFDWNVFARPGQFIMVWAPGMEEIPLSLSSVDEEKSITFKIIGRDTEFLSKLKEGDRIIYAKYAGVEFKRDGEEYLILNGEKDILAVIE